MVSGLFTARGHRVKGLGVAGEGSRAARTPGPRCEARCHNDIRSLFNQKAMINPK